MDEIEIPRSILLLGITVVEIGMHLQLVYIAQITKKKVYIIPFGPQVDDNCLKCYYDSSI